MHFTLPLGIVLVSFTAAPLLEAQCEFQRIDPTNGSAADGFGSAVAVSGDRVLVGAPEHDSVAAEAGAAYIYENVGGTWVEQLLTASDGAAMDAFGLSVAIDGDLAVIGAPADTPFGFNSGSAYVFERIGGTWTEVQKLTASNGILGDLYGISVSIEGDRIIVGACQVSSFQFFGFGNGRIFVYERSGGTFQETQIITASDGAPGDRFGVNHDAEGDLLLISAENKDITGPTSGAAYLFEYSGGTWNELDRIEPSDGVGGDFFSMGLALENGTAVCGSPNHAANGNNSGALYVFERSGSTWNETQKLLAGTGSAEDWLGRWVRFENGVIWSGAHSNNQSKTGSLHTWSNDGSAWVEGSSFVPTDAVVGDQHGYAFDVDGSRLMVGSRRASRAGATYEYSSVLSVIAPAGCDLNPAGSIALVSGDSVIGSSMTISLHNPIGTQTPGATLPIVAISNQILSLPNGCGLPFGWDMTGGGMGELLVDPGTLIAPSPIVLAPWTGTPVETTLDMPPSCALIGTDVVVQGVMLDTAAGPGDVKFALTRGLYVLLGQ